jgi:acetylornithine deacetylase/succinyl-diaminopimelate desuccinylase-like protein
MSGWSEVERGAREVVDADLEDLLGALRIPSISAHDRELGTSAAYLADVLRRDGWSAQIDDIDGNPMILAEIGPEGDDVPSVMLYGHHDVQPIDPESAWVTPPFEPAIRDGRIWGRGTADNKGQFFCHIFAVRALQRTLGRVPVRVKLVLDGREEIGSPEAPAFAARHRGELAGVRFCLTADGPTRLEERPEVSFGVRGMTKLRLTVRTAGTDLHSGNWGNLVPSAAFRLAQILAGLKGPDGRVVVPGFYDDVVPPTQAEREAIAEIPFDPEEARRSIDAVALDGPADVAPLERIMFLPTLTVNGMQSGYTGPGFKTVIPSEAFCYIDVRLVVDQDPDRVFERIRDHLAHLAPEATLEKVGHYLPSRTPIDHPEAAHVIAAIEDGFGARPLRVPCMGGSLPDAAFAVGLDIPVFDVPYGAPDQRNHAPNESMRLEHLRQGTAASASLLMRVGSAR